MAAGYVNLYIEQGTTYNTTIFLDNANYVTYNLTGYTANSGIRRSYYSANASAFFTTTVNANNGTIALSLAANTTANLMPGRYVYDTKLTDLYGNVSRIVEGIVEISPQVSY
jgi:hypothetical protein